MILIWVQKKKMYVRFPNGSHLENFETNIAPWGSNRGPEIKISCSTSWAKRQDIFLIIFKNYVILISYLILLLQTSSEPKI